MKKVLLSLMAAGLLVAFLATAVLARPPVDLTPELKAARAATAKYNAVTKALADGYVSTVECVEVPGVGGMGIHYVNFGIFDTVVDLTAPEVLLYAPTEGGVRLVAVEYVMMALANTGGGPAPWFDPAPPPGGWFTTAPTLFGQTMELMPGHEPGMPWHYDMHVWLWESNPTGIFEDWNPNVSCPEP